jgi:hypothetical protein
MNGLSFLHINSLLHEGIVCCACVMNVFIQSDAKLI